MSDLLNKIASAQRDAGERMVMKDLESKGLAHLAGRAPKKRKMTTNEKHAADAGVAYDPRCAPPPQLQEIESCDDVREALRRFAYAWQLPISNEEIKPASQDLIACVEWALNRIAELEHAVSAPSAEDKP